MYSKRGRYVINVYVIARAGVIFGIHSRVVGIAAVKSQEVKPSAISSLYRKRVIFHVVKQITEYP